MHSKLEESPVNYAIENWPKLNKLQYKIVRKTYKLSLQRVERSNNYGMTYKLIADEAY